MKKIAMFILLGVSALCSMADVSESDRKRWQATVYGGLYLNNEQAWQLEPSVTWNFHKYIGVTMGIELTGQYNQPSCLTVIDGHEAELADNERNVAWIIFKSSVVFRSPDVWHSDGGYYRLWFQAEPGISFACPFRNSLTYEIKEFKGGVSYTADTRRFPNKGLKWFYWNARASVNFAVDRFILGAGYYISNLDYYSGRRNVTLADGNKFHVPGKNLAKAFSFP